jgi:hypothetical protein
VIVSIAPLVAAQRQEFGTGFSLAIELVMTDHRALHGSHPFARLESKRGKSQESGRYRWRSASS